MSALLKRNLWDLATVLAVFLVCLGVSGLIFKLYTPILAEKYEERVISQRTGLVGGAQLTAVEDVALVDGVTELYSADNGSLLVTVKNQGFESEIVMNVVLSPDGAVQDVAAVSHNESPDKGGMALAEAYLEKYKGLTAAEGVDAYTGATYTSDAIKDSIGKALLQYQVVNGLEYTGPVTMSRDELVEKALNETLGADWAQADTELADKVTAVYRSPLGCACLVEGLGYDNDTTDAVGPSPIVLLVSFDKDGLVSEIRVIEQHETAGYGANAFNEYYLNMYDGYGSFVFKYSIPGIDAHVIDSQSNATGTSQSVYYLVKAAVDQLKLLPAA